MRGLGCGCGCKCDSCAAGLGATITQSLGYPGFTGQPSDFITGAAEWLTPGSIPVAFSGAVSGSQWFGMAGLVGVPILAVMLLSGLGGSGRRRR